MATPGFPPPFGAPSGPNTASPSEADIDPGACFLSGYLEHQQKLTLRLIRRRCVLTQATSFLHPVRPVRPELRRNHPLRPLRPDPPSNPTLRPDEISPRPGLLKTSQL